MMRNSKDILSHAKPLSRKGTQRFFVLVMLFIMVMQVSAQTINSYDTYMQCVATSNILYLAEQYNVEIAEAMCSASKVFNDPELEFAFSDNQENTLMMGRSYEATLGYDIPLAGVRQHRIAVAKNERDISQAELENYFAELQYEAALKWADAWQATQIEKLRHRSYESMKQIAQADSLRLALGEVNATDAMRTSLDAQTAYNEWLTAQAACRIALAELRIYTGGLSVDSVTELPTILFEHIELPVLQSLAQDNRADLKAVQISAQLARNNLKLVKANRAPEIRLSLGYAYNTEVRNEIAPAPAYQGVTVGATIPLKFSSINKGETLAATLAISQSDALLEAARHAIGIEVEQAYIDYVSSTNRLHAFNTDILSKSQQILQNCTYGYTQGESSLLELIDARREHYELMESYIETTTSAFTSALTLKRAIGWKSE